MPQRSTRYSVVLTGTCLKVCLEVGIFQDILCNTEMGYHFGQEFFAAEQILVSHIRHCKVGGSTQSEDDCIDAFKKALCSFTL